MDQIKINSAACHNLLRIIEKREREYTELPTEIQSSYLLTSAYGKQKTPSFFNVTRTKLRNLSKRAAHKAAIEEERSELSDLVDEIILENNETAYEDKKWYTNE